MVKGVRLIGDLNVSYVFRENITCFMSIFRSVQYFLLGNLIKLSCLPIFAFY